MSALEPMTSLAELRRRAELPVDAHKGRAGRVLCVAGSRAMPGAAILVVRAAQRAGAGLVTLACLDRELLTVVPGAAPEAIFLDASVDPGRVVGSAAHARAAGPGLGSDEHAWSRTRELSRRLLEERVMAPLVLDADALNVFASEPESLAACRSALVITPHPGEAARLLGRAVPRHAAGRMDAALELSRRCGAVACLKGHATVVADEAAGRVFVCPAGNPGMATAGTGDVLTGALVACLADVGEAAERGVAAWTTFDAAAWAVAMHAVAGDRAARERGRRGLIASDLVDELPAAAIELAGSSAGGG